MKYKTTKQKLRRAEQLRDTANKLKNDWDKLRVELEGNRMRSDARSANALLDEVWRSMDRVVEELAGDYEV